MSEDAFNMSIRKFLKEVGVTSQRKIEEMVREGQNRRQEAEGPHDADSGRHRPHPRGGRRDRTSVSPAKQFKQLVQRGRSKETAFTTGAVWELFELERPA